MNNQTTPHTSKPIKCLALTSSAGLLSRDTELLNKTKSISEFNLVVMYYRVKFRACPEVYFFELKQDKAIVTDVIHLIKKLFKIKHSSIKVYDDKTELCRQDFITSGRTYTIKRLPLCQKTFRTQLTMI